MIYNIRNYMIKTDDFLTVEDLKFDITKLQQALNQVLKIKKYDIAPNSPICNNIQVMPVTPSSTP